MLSDFLKEHITSGANYVKFGYGQVEPNHLSAQRTAQIYAQLPAASTIDKLEQGQFVKYDYAAGVCDFVGAGEWMLVFNEIKLYRDNQMDCEFAMLKDNYQARLYSPVAADTNFNAQSRYYNGVDNLNNSSITMTVAAGSADAASKTYSYDDVTAAPDMYEFHYNEDPFHIESQTEPAKMPTGTTMVPRVFKTNVGDIMTTNTINVIGSGASGAVVYGDGTTTGDLRVGNLLTPDSSDGILRKVVAASGSGDDATPAENPDMVWQVVKIYTLPDHQPAAKVMRIK